MNRELEDFFGAAGQAVIKDFLTTFGMTMNVSKYVPPGKYDALEKAIAEGDS